MLSASRSQRREVDLLLAPFKVPGKWFAQRNTPSHFQLVIDINQPAADLASMLAKASCVFEVEETFQRFLFHPGLGIHRQTIDEAGEVVLRAEQLRLELEQSSGNLREFGRRLRILQGTPWLDLLEPYRLELLRLDAMPRAV